MFTDNHYVCPKSSVFATIFRQRRAEPRPATNGYCFLRKLAAAKLANEKPGQTLQATALVHDAYLRLVDVEKAQHWNSRGHFYAAAAEAMRRILVENARRKKRAKHGGEWTRVNFEELDVFESITPEQLLQIDEAMEDLGANDPLASDLISLRYFGGLSLTHAAEVLEVSPATAYRHWAFARAFLKTRLDNEPG